MKRTILYCVSSSIILFILSFYFSDEIFDFFLLFFYDGHLNFVVTAVNGTFLIALKISLSIAIIPLILLIAWIGGRIESSRKRLFSILIVVGCMVLAMMLNVFRINSYLRLLTNLDAQISFPVAKLFFEYAISIGTIVGVVISYFIFRKRKAI